MTGRAPRLCKGLAVVTAEDAVVVDDGRRRHRFAGAAVTSALDPLLPLLDGSRDEAALASVSGLAAGTVRQVVGLLQECGLVEYPQPGPQAPDHVATYLSRTIDSTGGYRSADELLTALAGSSVVLVGRDPAADLVAQDLSEAGVGTVRRQADIAATAPEPVGAGRRAIVVVFDEPDHPQLLAKVVEAADAPVLRCARTGGSAQVGPLFFAGFTACPACFHRGWQELREDGAVVDEDHGSATGTEPVGPVGSLLAGLVGVEVLAVLAGVTEPSTIRRVTTVSVPDHTMRQWLVIPYRDCPTCGTHLAVGGESARVEEYEWQMERPPRALAWAGHPPRSERQRHEGLQRSRPAFPLAPRRALPAEDLPASGHPLLPALSGIMRRVAGFRSPGSESLARWTASGGNLGSTEVYVVSDDAVFDLPGGVVRYDDLTDEAVAVHAGRVPVARCLEGTGLSPDGVAAVVVLVAATGRLANKYGWFAYRLAHLDAGCAAVSLAATAARRGLSVCFAAGWPDDLAELLELEPGREVVTAVAALRSQPAGA